MRHPVPRSALVAVCVICLAAVAAWKIASWDEHGSARAARLASPGPAASTSASQTDGVLPHGSRFATSSAFASVPATAGAPLADLASPPGPTIASFDTARHEPGVRYRLVFEPYGYGPELAGPTIAARIVSCVREGGGGGGGDDLSLTGKSALLVLGKARIERGGRYEGTAALTEAGGRLVLVLEEARPSG